jgi:uncharacterized RDD family membrane protein YckC
MITLPSLLDSPDEGTTAASALEGAGFKIRAVARCIDLVVHFGATIAVGLAAMTLVAVGSALQGIAPDASLARLSDATSLSFAAATVGSLAMHVLCEGLHGSTVGKLVCGLTVISEDGTPATLAGAMKRSIAYFWDALFFGMVAAQKMSESPRRQRFGDAWGRTMVVRLSALAPSARRSWVRFCLSMAAGLATDGLVMFAELGYRLA